jgi:hypothetical protein
VWRARRASVRAFGLAALAEMFASLPSSRCKQSTVLWLRPSLRGVLERGHSTAEGEGQACEWTLRHHYLQVRRC